QRAGALQDLDRLEGLLDDDELVRVPEPCQQLQPVIVGVGGADDHLYLRVHLPQVFDGLEPVPPRWHAHVDEGDRVRTALRHSRAGAFDSIATLRSEEHTSELQSPCNLVCRLLLEKKKKKQQNIKTKLSI